MKIRRVVFASFSRAQYAFPFQSGVLKIKQQDQIQPCDIKLPDHLSYVRVGEASHHFRIDDRSIVNNQIRNEVANQFAKVENRKCSLNRKTVTSALQFNAHRPLKEILVKKFVKD